MANCPNCGLSTMRTKDWACQWCGYPLVSGIYGKTSKTFAELKQEREGEATSTALLVETEPTVEPDSETNEIVETELEPAPEPETSQVVEAEVEPAPEPEKNQIVEAEVEPAPEPETGQVVKPEVEPTPEPRTVQVVEAETEPEPSAPEKLEAEATIEPEPAADEEIQPVPEVTVAELCSSYQGYGMAGHEEFKNSVFRVSGIVDSIVSKDVVEQYRVALTDEEPHPLGDIYCKFEKKDAPALRKLSVGQQLTVQGRYDGFVTNIVMADCVLVN